MHRRRTFGILPDGTAVDVIALGSADGVEMHVLTYGCIIASLAVPDAGGHTANIVLGFDRLERTSTRRRTSVRWWGATRTASPARGSPSTAANIASHRTSRRIIFTGGSRDSTSVCGTPRSPRMEPQSSFAAEVPMAKKGIRARSTRRSPTRLTIAAADRLPGDD